MKDLKVFLLLISLSLGLILSSGITFAQQPSGSVKVYDVATSLSPNETAIELLDLAYTNSFTVVTSPSYLTFPLTSPAEIAAGKWNVTANISFILHYANATAGNEGVTIRFNYTGSGEIKLNGVTTNSSLGVNNCTISAYGSNNDYVNITCGPYDDTKAAEDLAIYPVLEWNITVSNLATFQNTSLPKVWYPDFNSSDIDYIQNFTLSAPFTQNINVNITLPERNVSITKIENNATAGTEGLDTNHYVWFRVDNVLTGTSPQISLRAVKIVYLNTHLHHDQVIPAYIGKNVTWISNYTLSYNSTYFNSLRAENVLFNHTLWSTGYLDKVVNTTSIQPISAGLTNGYLNLTFNLNYTNSTTIDIKEETVAPTQVEQTIGYSDGRWLKNVTVTNPFTEHSYELYLNSTFKSIGNPGLWYAGNNITSNIAWQDTDNDNYFEYVQWNYTIPADTKYNFTINGTRWAGITASLTRDWIYTDESTTISGDSKYMDNDAFPDYSPSNVTVLIYEHYPFQLIKSYVAEINTTTRSFSQAISGLLSGVYDVWVERTDEDNIFAKSPILTLYVYLRPSFSSISIPTPPPAKAEISIPSLPPGIMKAFDIEQANTPFTQVSISVKNRVVNVKISVEKLVEKPAVPEPRALVYHFISVTPVNIKDEDIAEAKIKFKVEKSWITQNNISVNTIALLRFSNNTWNKLTTTKVSEDANYAYFEAETPGFSYFAISGEKIVLAPPAPVCGNGICETGEDYINCPADCPAPKPKCTCTDWKNVGCRIAPCKQNEMKQTRTCSPAKCDLEERCITDPKCIPKPPAFPIWAIAIGVIVIIILILFILYKKNLMKM